MTNSIQTTRPMQELAAQITNTVRGGEGEYVQKSISPPMDVVKDLFGRPDPSFPRLANIVEAPALRPDGSLLCTPGYDPSTRLYYSCNESTTVAIPTRPTQEQAVGAAHFVDSELLSDFPFTDQTSRANMLATILAPLVRPMIEGSVPLAVINATAAGTGKTLLASLVATVATGRPGAMMAAPRAREEWVKTISAALEAGRGILIFDNCAGTIQAPELDLAITAQTYTGRRLGTSEMPEYRVRSTWIITGNNVMPAGDLPRRCYWIKLDAGMFRPELRKNFRHPDIIQWTTDNRGKLLSALLTMARGWIVAGRPTSDTPRLGSFEQWCEVAGGILAFSGVEGFLSTWADDREASDTETPQWLGFLSAVLDATHGNANSAAELESLIRSDEQLAAALPDEVADAYRDPRRSFTRTLGNAFKAIKGRRFDEHGLRVIEAGEIRRAIRWRVTRDDHNRGT